MWASPCDPKFAAVGAVNPHHHHPSIHHLQFSYNFQIRLYKTPFLLATLFNFSVLNFKLGVQRNYPLAVGTLNYLFFLSLKTQQWCRPTQPRSQCFLMQSNWLEKTANQLLCVGKEALGMRFMPTKSMVRRYVIDNA